MGGLDARAAAHILKNNEIGSICTVSTPHKGSSLAKAKVKPPKEVGALFDLTVERLATFDKEYPDKDNIRYFSVAGTQQVAVTHPLYIPQQLLAKLEPTTPNDGMVSLESAKHGQYLQEFELNHWSEVGWLCGEREHLPMYRYIVETVQSAAQKK
jgi:triacylglycerol lipase